MNLLLIESIIENYILFEQDIPRTTKRRRVATQYRIPQKDQKDPTVISPPPETTPGKKKFANLPSFPSSFPKSANKNVTTTTKSQTANKKDNPKTTNQTLAQKDINTDIVRTPRMKKTTISPEMMDSLRVDDETFQAMRNWVSNKWKIDADSYDREAIMNTVMKNFDGGIRGFVNIFGDHQMMRQPFKAPRAPVQQPPRTVKKPSRYRSLNIFRR